MKRYVHLGERALADLRAQYISTKRRRSKVPFSGRGASIGATVAGFGGTVGVTAPTAAGSITAYDDAERVEEYLGQVLLNLSNRPEAGRGSRIEYLSGQADFSALFVPSDGMGTTHQMTYSAWIESSCDGVCERGLLFLVGSLRHSRWRGEALQVTAWTPSSPEGLRYAFHLRRGDPPATFNPVAGYDLPAHELAYLADEILVLARGAFDEPHYKFRGSFVCQVHGCFHADDAADRYYSSIPRIDPPAFCLFGAPLVLAEDP